MVQVILPLSLTNLFPTLPLALLLTLPLPLPLPLLPLTLPLTVTVTLTPTLTLTLTLLFYLKGYLPDLFVQDRNLYVHPELLQHMRVSFGK